MKIRCPKCDVKPSSTKDYYDMHGIYAGSKCFKCNHVFKNEGAPKKIKVINR